MSNSNILENNIDKNENNKIQDYLENLKREINISNNNENNIIDDYQNTAKNNSSQLSSENSHSDFQNRLKNFLDKNKVKLYILTPCYGGLCHVNYVTKIIETKELLKELGIQVSLQFIKNESLITRARNNMIAKSLYDNEMTHVLFIDNDITWQPVDILKLLISEKELIGGTYPIKKYNWDRLNKENIEQFIKNKKISYNTDLTDREIIYHNLLNYNFNHLQNNVSIENNYMEVYTLATGFMMIKRSCLEKMIQCYSQYKYIDDCGYLEGDENKYAYALFDCGIINNHYFSEDWLFCHRWKEIGGKIFIDISINLWHTGQEDYCGRLLSTLDIK